MVQPAASQRHRGNITSTHFPEDALARARDPLGYKRHRRQPCLAWHAGARAEEVLVGVFGTWVRWSLGIGVGVGVGV
jgi:hypothetical protein